MTLRPPGTVSNLNRRMALLAKGIEWPFGRVQQRVFSDVFCSLLKRAHDSGVIAGYVLKGGMAIELRIEKAARTSTDTDVTLKCDSNDVIGTLDAILAVGLDDFKFSRAPEPRYLTKSETYRVEIRIDYATRRLGTLSVDINGSLDEYDEVETARSSFLGDLGFPQEGDMVMLGLHLQVAHKIHGATEPSTEEYKNRRFKDVVDVLLLDQHCSIDHVRLRRIAEDEFLRRSKHAWPPRLALTDEWKRGLEDEARKAALSLRDAEPIAAAFNALIGKVAAVEPGVLASEGAMIIQVLGEGLTGAPGLAPS